MRKLAIAAICAAIALALTGCGNTTVEKPSEQPTTRIVSTGGIVCKILTDTKTGVQYLYVCDSSYGGAITPLLNADGTPYVEVE